MAWSTRRTWRRFWLVDPLDGTKEFIKRNGEFSVNVALIEDGAPILGVVQEPVTGVWHLGFVDHGGPGAAQWRRDPGLLGASVRGAAKLTQVEQPTLKRLWRGRGALSLVGHGRPAGRSIDRPRRRLRVAVSRSHRTERLHPLLASWPTTERVSLGSSLKYTRMVDGELDVYPRLGPTSGWDTAAAHAVLVAAGGCMVEASGAALRYNEQPSLLNPCFLALADAAQLPLLLPAFQRAAHTDWC